MAAAEAREIEPLVTRFWDKAKKHEKVDVALDHAKFRGPLTRSKMTITWLFDHDGNFIDAYFFRIT
jgi:hypothetical protein